MQDRIDAATIANHQRNLASGKPISQDLLEQAAQAAQRQGLPVYETKVEQPVPGFWGGVSRILPGGETGMEQVNTLGIGNPPGTPVLSAPPAPAPAAPPAMTADRARAAAVQILQEHGYPVTEKNVAAIIQRGFGGR
jgi:nucleotide-binding universal stress UspA family protein